MSENKKVKVLLADDEKHIRALMKVAVASMGAEVVAEAVNGVEAVELFKEHSPNMVLLDINMPVLDGRGALEKIIKINPTAFVVMLTSLSAMDVVKECIEIGASNCIRKDTPLAEIKKLIKESWMEHKVKESY